MVDPRREAALFSHWTPSEVSSVSRARSAAQSSVVDALVRDAVAANHSIIDDSNTGDQRHEKRGKRNAVSRVGSKGSRSLVEIASDRSVPPGIAVRLMGTAHQALGTGRSPGPVFYLEPDDLIDDAPMRTDLGVGDSQCGNESGRSSPGGAGRTGFQPVRFPPTP